MPFLMLACLHCASAALLPESRLVIPRSSVLRTTAAVLANVPFRNPTKAAFAIPPPDLLAKAPEAPSQLQDQMKVFYTPPSVKGISTPSQIALANHLSKTGAKFYGAYWCSYCLRQRSMFGAGGSRALPYVECADDGYKAQRCPKEVTGYPSWEIRGKLYGGMQTLQQLQVLSGFDPSVHFPDYIPSASPPRPPPPPGGFKPPPVETASTDEALALAKHLRATNARFYGAYWCKYCGIQRQLFGAEAVRSYLPYVECAVDGYQSQRELCASNPDLRAYPTWELNGKLYSGLKSIDELKELSGFVGEGSQGRLGIDFAEGATVFRSGNDCVLPDGGVESDAAGRMDCNTQGRP